MTADNVVDFHPPLTKLEAVPNPDDPESYLCNIPMTFHLAKVAGTPQGNRFYRTYVAAYHALSGQPLAHKAREEQAFRSACTTCGWTLRS